MNPLMVFEDVPLVTTAIFGDFFDPEPIGHHYGDLSASRVRCIKIEPTLYLVGAHPWQVITACYVAGHKTAEFAPLTRIDIDGVTRQYVQLVAPAAEENTVVAVSGKGKMSGTHGRLIENPDEIIADIARLCGRSMAFPLFREACYKKDLRIAGSVAEAKSLRFYVNEIAQSCGAMALNDSMVFIGDVSGYATPVLNPQDVTLAIDVGAVAGKLGVWYAWNHALDHNGGYIELAAKGCPYDNTGIYFAKWLRQPKDAEELARRLLGLRAGEFFNVSAKLPGVVRAGNLVEFVDQVYNGKVRILTSTPGEAESDVTGTLILSSYPNLTVTHLSSEDQTVRSERVDVLLDLVKREATITIFDSQNRPLPNISIVYDNAVTKRTNALGSAKFQVTSGTHTIALFGDGIDNSDPYPLIIP
jgi:hypothetical protein